MLPFDNGSPAPQKPEGGNKPPHPNKHYDFFVDGTKYRTEHMLLTGAQIKQIAHVPAEFALILIHPGQFFPSRCRKVRHPEEGGGDCDSRQHFPQALRKARDLL